MILLTEAHTKHPIFNFLALNLADGCPTGLLKLAYN
jgi:hypothetical protein